MHFSGLAGMPRRIAEYPSVFHTWNYVASFGALISTVATLVFLFMLFHAFWFKKPIKESIHKSVVEMNMPKLFYTSTCEKELHKLNNTLERHNLLHVANKIAFKRPTKFLGLLLSPLLGLPTHHSKYVAFQTPATGIMEGIVDLHHDIMVILVFIIIFVLYLLGSVIAHFTVSIGSFYADELVSIHGYAGDNVTHNTPIEII